MDKTKRLSTIKAIIDTAKKACINEEGSNRYQITLIELTAKMDHKILEETLIEATIHESEETVAMLSGIFDEEILTSSLIEFAKEGNINRIIKLADSDCLEDPTWVIQQALMRAKRNNIPKDIMDVLSLAIEKHKTIEECEGNLRALVVLGDDKEEVDV